MRSIRALPVWAAVIVAMLLPGAAPAAATPAGVRVDLRVLVVSGGEETTAAIARQLDAEGVPYDTVDLADPGRPVIDAAFLADVVDGVPRARYQAIVLPNADPFGNPTELAAIADYERQYGIPQVDAFVWPSAQVGLQFPTYAGALDGVTALATGDALAGDFRYLRAAVPFEDNDASVAESYGYLAEPAEGADFTPLLTGVAPGGGQTGVLAGEFRADGRRQLVLTFAFNAYQQQFRLLAHGIVSWLTGGVHLGHYRNYFALHIDDVFLPDSRWSVAGNCTPGDDCTGPFTTPDIRMTAADVAYAVNWQEDHDFTFDMLFNGVGSVEAAEELGAPDPLTQALLAERASFRWANHTYTHQFLGCVQDFTVRPWRCATESVTGEIRYLSQAEIQSEIASNLAWAAANNLTVDPTELVTGEHSGMRLLPQQPQDNPNLAPAVAATGVAWLGGDNSRDRAQRPIGPAATVPRHPMNLFYNVATAAEEVDEYNWIYTSRANGGSGICEDNPATTTCIAPLDPVTGYYTTMVQAEARIALSHALANDPRPHYAHQSNLAEDRLAYPLLEFILGWYRAVFDDNTPIVSPDLSDSGVTIRRQDRWRAALAAGQVTAYLRDGQVVVDAPAGLDVPLTVPGGTVGGAEFGQPYAGERSGYLASEGTGITLTLP